MPPPTIQVSVSIHCGPFEYKMSSLHHVMLLVICVKFCHDQCMASWVRETMCFGEITVTLTFDHKIVTTLSLSPIGHLCFRKTTWEHNTLGHSSRCSRGIKKNRKEKMSRLWGLNNILEKNQKHTVAFLLCIHTINFSILQDNLFECWHKCSEYKAKNQTSSSIHFQQKHVVLLLQHYLLMMRPGIVHHR